MRRLRGWVAAALAVMLVAASAVFLGSAWLVETLGDPGTYVLAMRPVGQDARVRDELGALLRDQVVGQIDASATARSELAQWRVAHPGVGVGAYLDRRIDAYLGSGAYASTWDSASWLSQLRMGEAMRAGRSHENGAVYVKTGQFLMQLKPLLVKDGFTPAASLSWQHPLLTFTTSRFLARFQRHYPQWVRVPKLAAVAMALLVAAIVLFAPDRRKAILAAGAAGLLAAAAVGATAVSARWLPGTDDVGLRAAWLAGLETRLWSGAGIMAIGGAAVVVAARRPRGA